MLKEIEHVEQNDPGLIRRWFVDDYFELILWADADGTSVEMQLCYDRKRFERVMIWRQGSGFKHQQVDDGEDRPGKAKATPIFIPDGEFDWQSLAERFQAASTEIDQAVAQFVGERIREFV